MIKEKTIVKYLELLVKRLYKDRMLDSFTMEAIPNIVINLINDIKSEKIDVNYAFYFDKELKRFKNKEPRVQEYYNSKVSDVFQVIILDCFDNFDEAFSIYAQRLIYYVERNSK